jgi:hypothetical protein
MSPDRSTGRRLSVAGGGRPARFHHEPRSHTVTETPDRFRKRPVEIEARQWDGTADGATRIIDWILGHGSTASYICSNPDRCQENDGDTPHSISIHTLEGTMRADLDDWVIREPFPTGDRQFYPCKPDIFAKTYEPAAVVAAGPAPATDQDDLRDRIAEGLLDHLSRTADIRPSKAGPLAFMPEVTDEERMRLADAVLSVLPASIDQAAVRAEAFREAAVAVRRGAFADTFDRMADETPQPETEPPLLFWDESAGAVHHDGRVAVWINKAVNLAEFAPAGQLILQVQAAGQLRDALGAALAEAAPAVVAQPDEEADDAPPAPLRRSEDDCPGFPEQCPDIRPVDPNPPVHYGGIRCGCADEEPS